MRTVYRFAMPTVRLRNATQNDDLFPLQDSIIAQSSSRDFDMQRFILALAAISLVLLFSACGQSGPLYLPGNPSKLETIPPAPTESDEEEDDDEQDNE